MTSVAANIAGQQVMKIGISTYHTSNCLPGTPPAMCSLHTKVSGHILEGTERLNFLFLVNGADGSNVLLEHLALP